MPSGGFPLPTFNLVANVWHGQPLGGPYPPAAPVDVTTDCQLAEWSRLNVHVTGAAVSLFIQIRVPKGTDLRGHLSASAEDIAEVPAGSGRFYSIFAVDDVGKGFANEYRCAYATQLSIPTPLT